MKFTILKYQIHWFLVYSQDCASITTIQFQNISIISKNNPQLFVLIPNFFLSQTSNLLSITMDLPFLEIL